MTFKSMTIRNFKSISKELTIDFTDNGLHLIQGSNGAGKSTLLHAIVYALYGTAINPKGNGIATISNSSLINRIKKKDLSVTLVLDTHTIIRTMKPNTLTIFDSNGTDVSIGSSKAIDDEYIVNNILSGIELKTFLKRNLVNNKQSSSPFLYLSKNDRKMFVENLLGIDILRHIKDTTKDRTSKYKNELLSANYELTNVTNNLDNAKEIKDTIEDNNKDNEEAILKEIQAYKFDIDKIEMELSLKDVDNINSKHDEYTAKLNKVNDLISTINTKRNDITLKLNTITTKLNSYDSQLVKFKACGACPTVKDIIGHVDRDKYISNIDKCNVVLKQIDAKEDKLIKTKNKLETALGRLSIELDVISDLRREISRLNSNIDRLSVPKVSNDDKLTKINDKIDKLVIEHANIEAKHKEIELLYNNCVDIGKLIKDDKIRVDLFSEYLPYIESTVNSYLCRFDDSLEISINDGLDISLIKNNKEIDIFSQSDGELSSINFSFLLTFIKLGLELDNSVPILLIDEILDIALDGSRLGIVIEALKDISVNIPIYVISHNSDIDLEMFDRIINVVKVDDIYTDIEFI